jgi:hypothetical protein
LEYLDFEPVDSKYELIKWENLISAYAFRLWGFIRLVGTILRISSCSSFQGARSHGWSGESVQRFGLHLVRFSCVCCGIGLTSMGSGREVESGPRASSSIIVAFRSSVRHRVAYGVLNSVTSSECLPVFVRGKDVIM